ncbi:MAG: hypothetical protein AAFX94_06545 [Myxococcota bacterium]
MESSSSTVVIVSAVTADLPVTGELAKAESDADSEGDKPPPASLSLVPEEDAPTAAPSPFVFDLERVPMHLREIFIYAQRWGMADVKSRRERLARTTEGELRQIADAVAPYLDDIRAWFDSGERCVELQTYLAVTSHPPCPIAGHR